MQAGTRTIRCGICWRKLLARSRMRGLSRGRWRVAAMKVVAGTGCRAWLECGAGRWAAGWPLPWRWLWLYHRRRFNPKRSTIKRMCRMLLRLWRTSIQRMRIPPLPLRLHGKIRLSKFPDWLSPAGRRGVELDGRFFRAVASAANDDHATGPDSTRHDFTYCACEASGGETCTPTCASA